MFELFISRRYLKSKHSMNFITIISVLSTLGITIGVASLIVVISVFNGFGSLVTKMLINFDPHLSLSIMSDSMNGLNVIEASIKNDKRVSSAAPFLEGKALLLNNNQYHVIKLKGITNQVDSENWGIQSVIVKGQMKLNENNGIGYVTLGQRMAMRLSCTVGDTIYVSSFRELERIATNFTAIPQVRRLIVSALFVTNNKDYDVEYAFTSLKTAQKIYNVPKTISGYEIRLHDIDESEAVKSDLLSQLPNNNVTIHTWFDLHRDLYSVMLIERWSAFILLSLIISVATFNILGSLTMSVIEKRKDIGILRAMGTIKNSILKIFIYEGILIGIIGTISGLVIGLLICYLQIEYKFYPLDPAKYIIDAIPVEIRITDILAVSFASLFLTYLASLYPAKRAVRINIIDAIKYE